MRRPSEYCGQSQQLWLPFPAMITNVVHIHYPNFSLSVQTVEDQVFNTVQHRRPKEIGESIIWCCIFSLSSTGGSRSGLVESPLRYGTIDLLGLEAFLELLPEQITSFHRLHSEKRQTWNREEWENGQMS